jgi:hypothetical protein
MQSDISSYQTSSWHWTKVLWVQTSLVEFLFPTSLNILHVNEESDQVLDYEKLMSYVYILYKK